MYLKHHVNDQVQKKYVSRFERFNGKKCVQPKYQIVFHILYMYIKEHNLQKIEIQFNTLKVNAVIAISANKSAMYTLIVIIIKCSK